MENVSCRMADFPAARRLRHSFDAAIEWLYGDAAKTRRTLGLCGLGLALAFVLVVATPAVCGA